jgi:hypothetical protein
MKATYLGYIIKTGVDTSRTSPDMQTEPWVMLSCMLQPDLVLGGLAALGPPKPPNMVKVQPILNMV